jgi:hypothetical protein
VPRALTGPQEWVKTEADARIRSRAPWRRVPRRSSTASLGVRCAPFDRPFRPSGEFLRPSRPAPTGPFAPSDKRGACLGRVQRRADLPTGAPPPPAPHPPMRRRQCTAVLLALVAAGAAVARAVAQAAGTCSVLAPGTCAETCVPLETGARRTDFACGDWWTRANCCNGTEQVPFTTTNVYYRCSCASASCARSPARRHLTAFDCPRADPGLRLLCVYRGHPPPSAKTWG